MKFTHQFEYNLKKHGPIEFEIVSIETWERNERNNGGFTIRWASAKVGFGEIDYVFGSNGVPRIGTETFGKEFALAALQCVVENAELID